MIKKIGPEELQVGMYVCGMEKEAGKPLFFMNNILLKSAGDREKMASNGYACVYINVDDEPAVQAESPDAPDKGVDGLPAGVVTQENSPAWQDIHEEAVEARELVELDELVPEETPAVAERSFDEELKEARRLRDEAELLVRDFLQNVRLGKDIDTGKVGGTVGRMVDSVFRNADALTSLARLKSFDDYTFAHSVNVCILSIALGREMGIERDGLSELGMGAILHDIGKVRVPEGVLNKPGKLSDEEFSVIRRHTELGGELLEGTKIKEGSKSVVMQHHERFDGNGYCRGLAKDGIHLYARIAAVADVYDAMTSNRVYQKGMVPEEALKKLYLMRRTHFEPQIVERLIKCLGIYPIGTFVELNTGELAVVKMVNRSHPMQPRVEVLSDRMKRPLEAPVETDLKDEIGRWIVATRRPEEFAPQGEPLAS